MVGWYSEILGSYFRLYLVFGGRNLDGCWVENRELLSWWQLLVSKMTKGLAKGILMGVWRVVFNVLSSLSLLCQPWNGLAASLSFLLPCQQRVPLLDQYHSLCSTLALKAAGLSSTRSVFILCLLNLHSFLLYEFCFLHQIHAFLLSCKNVH